jgi:hypothetical protein
MKNHTAVGATRTMPRQTRASRSRQALTGHNKQVSAKVNRLLLSGIASTSSVLRHPLVVCEFVPPGVLPACEVYVLHGDRDGTEEHVLLEPVAVPDGRLKSLALDHFK